MGGVGGVVLGLGDGCWGNCGGNCFLIGRDLCGGFWLVVFKRWGW